MTTFSVRLRELCEQAGENMELVCRKVGIDMYSELILRSPVKSGRFRSNWFLSIGAPLSLTTERISDETTLIAQATAELPAKLSGTVVYITNSLPYARRLEYGWSKQAPAGMVGLTAQRFNDLVTKATSEVRS